MPFTTVFSRVQPLNLQVSKANAPRTKSRSHSARASVRHDRQLWSGAICLGVLVTQVGCQAAKPVGSSSSDLPSQVDTTPIGTLQKQTSSTQAATVYLNGTIGKRAPLLQGAVYELQDPTGSIWVRVQGTMPQSGAKVTIKGTTRYQMIDQDGESQKSLFIDQVDLLRN
jgi:hypothetical protein